MDPQGQNLLNLGIFPPSACFQGQGRRRCSHSAVVGQLCKPHINRSDLAGGRGSQLAHEWQLHQNRGDLIEAGLAKVFARAETTRSHRVIHQLFKEHPRPRIALQVESQCPVLGKVAAALRSTPSDFKNQEHRHRTQHECRVPAVGHSKHS